LGVGKTAREATMKEDTKIIIIILTLKVETTKTMIEAIRVMVGTTMTMGKAIKVKREGEDIMNKKEGIIIKITEENSMTEEKNNTINPGITTAVIIIAINMKMTETKEKKSGKTSSMRIIVVRLKELMIMTKDTIIIEMLIEVMNREIIIIIIINQINLHRTNKVKRNKIIMTIITTTTQTVKRKIRE